MEPRATIRQGYLLLADISGYTAFLTQSELDHAQDILHTLFQTLLDEMKPPLVVCELEGDAVFAYAPMDSFLQGRTFVEIIENLYCAFASAQEQMQRNMTCTCTACRLIPTLGLKFVAHHGTFALQRLAGRGPAKPSGPDVILVHRLLKNRIKEETGVEAYAFLTDACAHALRLDALAETLTPHTEHYEHLGPVRGYVYDLYPFWAGHREQLRFAVSPDDAWFTATTDLPVLPPLAWDFLNEPAHKGRWRGSDEVRVFGLRGGRTGLGTEHHCVHGKTVIAEQIIDWRPFDYVTVDARWPLGTVSRATTHLSPTAGGTRAVWRIGKPKGRNAIHTFLAGLFYDLVMKKKLRRDYQQGLDTLRTALQIAPTAHGLVEAEAAV